jgi:hypothetical protein
MNFNDRAVDGDLRAGDGAFGAALQPAAAFPGLLGQIRVDVDLSVDGRQIPVHFDLYFSPQPPATWRGDVQDKLADGNLLLVLPVQVAEAGRYVVTGRVDDAQGRPFALLTFNDELAAGAQDVPLRLFGRLIRDARPVFPLRLRDVEGFLLRPDTFPDRLLMPRRQGVVHTTAEHPMLAFSTQAWTGEERERYLAELTRDVEQAQQQVDRLQPAP